VRARGLRIVVPGLPGPAVAGDSGLSPAAAATERLLVRADRVIVGAAGLEPALFSLFEIEPPPPGGALPVAAVARAADTGAPAPGWWLRADPVHLRADRDRLLLFDQRLLAVQPEEAQALVAELNALFGADGLHFEAPVPARWYVRLTADPGLSTHPPAALIGRDIDRFMPAGQDARRWHALLTEAQMLMHASSVNREREARGNPQINSIWPWGGGELPARVAGRWSRVWAEEPVARGLAQLAGIAHAPPPPTAAHWLVQAGPGEHLLVLEHAYGPAAYGDAPEWSDAVEALEHDWLAPLEQALRTGAVQLLCLLPGDGSEYRITRAALRRFWRRRRPLLALLQ
jgi:hypothetical protein